MKPKHVTPWRPIHSLAAPLILLSFAAVLPAAPEPAAAQPASKPGSTWPQAYSVRRDDGAGVLTLQTPFYTFEHDLKRGGTITRIALKNGRSPNLLVRPLEARVQDEGGAVLTDLRDAMPQVTHRRAGLNENRNRRVRAPG